MNETPEYINCPCCLSAYSRVDNPLEWNRVCAWNPLKYAAKTLGARNKGHTKNLTDAQREARRVQLAINRNKGKVVKS